MIVDNAKQVSLCHAIARTFDGVHPCSLCHIVNRGKTAEKKSGLQLLTPKSISSAQNARSLCFGRSFISNIQ